MNELQLKKIKKIKSRESTVVTFAHSRLFEIKVNRDEIYSKKREVKRKPPRSVKLIYLLYMIHANLEDIEGHKFFQISLLWLINEYIL